MVCMEKKCLSGNALGPQETLLLNPLNNSMSGELNPVMIVEIEETLWK